MNPFVQLGIIGCVALACILWKPSAKIFKYLTTLFHEVGHACVALLLGGHIQHIKIQPNGSGVTSTAHAITLKYKIVRILELLAGYSFPVNTGVVLLGLGIIGVDPLFMLVFVGLVAGFTLLFIRNFFGLLVVFSYAVIAFAGYFFRDVIPVNYTISFLAFILIFGGIKDIQNVTKMTFSNQNDKNDFHFLRDETLIPARIWNIGFIISEVIVIALFLFLFSNYHDMVQL